MFRVEAVAIIGTQLSSPKLEFPSFAPLAVLLYWVCHMQESGEVSASNEQDATRHRHTQEYTEALVFATLDEDFAGFSLPGGYSL